MAVDFALGRDFGGHGAQGVTPGGRANSTAMAMDLTAS